MSFRLTTPKNTRGFLPVAKPAGLIVARGALYAISPTTGLLALGGVGLLATQIAFVAQENISVIDNRLSGTFLLASEDDEYIVDTVANTNVSHNGQRMLLDATGQLLNNTGTDAGAGIFQQMSVVGVAADRKIIARKV